MAGSSPILLTPTLLTQEKDGIDRSKSLIVNGCHAKQKEGYGQETTTHSAPQDWISDPQNPVNWSPWRKWVVIWLLVVTNMIA